MDGSPPVSPTLTTRLLSPVVSLGCRWFAADWTRSPWQLVERDLDHVQIQWADWAYVSARSGTKPSLPDGR